MGENEQIAEIMLQMMFGIGVIGYTQFTLNTSGIEYVRRALTLIATYGFTIEQAELMSEHWHQMLQEERRKERETWLKEK